MLFTPNYGCGKVKEVSRSYLNKSFFLHFLHPWKLVCSACYDQCITIRQRTTRYPFVHRNALFLCTFFAYFTLALFSCCSFSRVASCCTRFMSHFFCVALISYMTLSVFDFIHDFILFHMAVFGSLFKFAFFVLYPVHVAPFCLLHCTHLVLHFFHIALFSSFTFFVLHTFRVALFKIIDCLSHKNTKKHCYKKSLITYVKKTFKSSSFPNISSFHNGFVWNPSKVQRSLF